MSCNNDELQTDDPVKESIKEPTDQPEGNEITTPCGFDLSKVQANQTIVINCLLDLGGDTVNLPANVKLLYEGGDIINGTLNFSTNNSISGQLLSASLNLTGSIPLIKDPVFEFKPQRWGIVQGNVSDQVALKNRDILQSVIDQTKQMGVNVFHIDAIDAYFHLRYSWTDAKGYNDIAIHLPSNFHLRMTEKTHLRLQPNNWPFGAFISVYDKTNVKISGGNIYGDRFTHDYSDILDEVGISRFTHEWPGLLIIAGSSDVVIDGMYLTNSTGDAVIFGASNGFRNENVATKTFNQNVILKNSTTNASRRNNITITDGKNLTVENCKILNGGNGDNIYDLAGNKIISSAGIAPRVGIDIEPIWGWNETDGFIFREKVEQVYIRGCTFIDNVVASFIDYSGIDVTVENCISDNGFASAQSTGGKYFNNVLVASEKFKDATGITMGSMDVTINGQRQQLSENNIVKGNRVEGFVFGTVVRGNNCEVSNNTYIDNWVGLKILTTENTKFDNNSFKSNDKSDSGGISLFDGVAKNLTFSNMTIDMPRYPLEIIGLNSENPQYYLKFINCSFKSQENYPLIIKDSPNVSFTNTTLINTMFDVTNSPNFSNN